MNWIVFSQLKSELSKQLRYCPLRLHNNLRMLRKMCNARDDWRCIGLNFNCLTTGNGKIVSFPICWTITFISLSQPGSGKIWENCDQTMCKALNCLPIYALPFSLIVPLINKPFLGEKFNPLLPSQHLFQFYCLNGR